MRSVGVEKHRLFVSSARVPPPGAIHLNPWLRHQLPFLFRYPCPCPVCAASLRPAFNQGPLFGPLAARPHRALGARGGAHAKSTRSISKGKGNRGHPVSRTYGRARGHTRSGGIVYGVSTREPTRENTPPGEAMSRPHNEQISFPRHAKNPPSGTCGSNPARTHRRRTTRCPRDHRRRP